MKAMRLSEYFARINPKYVALQLIPSTSNRNYDTELIAGTIADMNMLPLVKRIHKEKLQKGFRITYHMPEKTAFIIQLEPKDCRFYMIVPEFYETLFISKCMEVWKRVTVKKLDDMPAFHGELQYALQYTQHDALSLKINKKSNEPLNNLLAVKNVMTDGEQIDILTNLIPCSQRTWSGKYNTAMQQIKWGLPVDKQKLNALVILQYSVSILFCIIDFVFSMVDSLIFDGKKENKEVYKHDKLAQLTPYTIKKESAKIVQTQILICSNGPDPHRRENNAKTIIESYKTIAADNALVAREITPDKQSKKPIKEIDVTRYEFHNVPKNLFSTGECNNLIQLPGRELIQALHVRTKVDVLENPVPDELQTGNVPLGIVSYKEKKQIAYQPAEYNTANLALMLLGPQGSGKTNYIGNMCRCTSAVKESNIIVDYVKNCELSEAVKQAVKGDVIDIDLSQQQCFQAFAFNEVQYSGDNEFQQFEVANMKAEQTLSFVDAINKDGLPLTGNMRRVLNAAANVVYLHNGASVGDVIKCLEKHTVRHEYIDYVKNKLSSDGQAYFEDIIEALEELDKVEIKQDPKTKEITSREIVGTRRNEIEGILDRINMLKENIYCKYMFNMKADRNIDFVKAMEQGKTVLIRMPEHKYSNTMVKNVLVTFFTSKIMLATKLRGALHDKPTRCNVYYDEIYQAPTAMGVITATLSQLRKFGTKLIISAHHLEQLTPELSREMHGSGASYMIFQGCAKQVYNQLKDEMQPFELEDVLNLKPYHCINLIRTKQGYQKFITQLPKPLF